MPTKLIKSINICFKILSLFSGSKPALDANEIGQSLDLHKSSVYRYLNSLIEESALEYDPGTKRYRLGRVIYWLATNLYHQDDIRRVAIPFMQELSRSTKETVHLAVVKGDMAMCLERVESEHPVRLSVNVGKLFPLHGGATARVLMAFLPEEEQDKIIQKGLRKFTKYTITDPGKLKKVLKEIRENGLAYSDQELDLGARAISTPIFDFMGNTVASLTVAGPKDRFTANMIQKSKELILDYSRRISAKLGYSHDEPRQ